jgi:hypothetical protein
MRFRKGRENEAGGGGEEKEMEDGKCFFILFLIRFGFYPLPSTTFQPRFYFLSAIYSLAFSFLFVF